RDQAHGDGTRSAGHTITVRSPHEHHPSHLRAHVLPENTCRRSPRIRWSRSGGQTDYPLRGRSSRPSPLPPLLLLTAGAGGVRIIHGSSPDPEVGTAMADSASTNPVTRPGAM